MQPPEAGLQQPPAPHARAVGSLHATQAVKVSLQTGVLDVQGISLDALQLPFAQVAAGMIDSGSVDSSQLPEPHGPVG